MMDIYKQVKKLEAEMIARRRDLHKFPESAWTEFRTASIVAEELDALGFAVLTGEQVMVECERMGVPDEAELERCRRRALDEGANPAWVDKMTGGRTGVVGIMRFAKPGKTVAFRVDMDCNEVAETNDLAHFPNQQGFASAHAGLMHACGHDGHTTMGLALAKLLANNRDAFTGTVKLIFQCAEEGVRGARAMTASGIVDDVDYLFGMHITKETTGKKSIVCMAEGQLATTKLDAYFQGVPTHPAAPENGKNAVLAAAQATVSLHSIPRHGKGASFLNVGIIQGGTGRNVIADHALLKLETRGMTSEINDYMEREARRMIAAAANLYDVKMEIKAMGSAPSGVPDAETSEEIYNLLQESGCFEKLIRRASQNGSEDCTYFMGRVQEKGGHAVYLKAGTAIAAGNHTAKYDFGEDVMVCGAAAFGMLARHFTNK